MKLRLAKKIDRQPGKYHHHQRQIALHRLLRADVYSRIAEQECQQENAGLLAVI